MMDLPQDLQSLQNLEDEILTLLDNSQATVTSTPVCSQPKLSSHDTLSIYNDSIWKPTLTDLFTSLHTRMNAIEAQLSSLKLQENYNLICFNFIKIRWPHYTDTSQY